MIAAICTCSVSFVFDLYQSCGFVHFLYFFWLFICLQQIIKLWRLGRGQARHVFFRLGPTNLKQIISSRPTGFGSKSRSISENQHCYILSIYRFSKTFIHFLKFLLIFIIITIYIVSRNLCNFSKIYFKT